MHVVCMLYACCMHVPADVLLRMLGLMTALLTAVTAV